MRRLAALSTLASVAMISACGGSGGSAFGSGAEAGDSHSGTSEAGVEPNAATDVGPWGTCAPMRWTQGASEPAIQPDDSQDFVLTPLPDGRVLIGAAESIYDPKTDTYEWLPSWSWHRDRAVPVVMKGGRSVLITGGWGGMDSLDTVSILDLTTLKERFTTHMLLNRAGHSGVLLADGRIMIVGGGNYEDMSAPAAEIFDPTTERWTATAPADLAALNVGFDGRHVIMLGDDDLWVAQGCGNYRYTPSTDTWRKTSDEPHHRYLDTVIRLPDGRIFTQGAGTCAVDPVSESRLFANVYDPRSDTWSPRTPSLHGERFGFLLPCGRLVTFDAGNPWNHTDIYDPANDRWFMDVIRSPDDMGGGGGLGFVTAAMIGPDTMMYAWGMLDRSEPKLLRLPGYPLLLAPMVRSGPGVTRNESPPAARR